MAEPVLPDLYEALMTTRAMRRFGDGAVPDDVVESILAAAVQAPSGGNIQPYQFVVVRDPDRRAALADIYLRSWLRYEPAVAKVTPPPASPEAAETHRRNWEASNHLAHHLAEVPVLILVLVPRISMAVSDDEGTMDVGPVHASVYPAVQNLILAARAYGLGTVLTTVYKVYEDEVRAVCEIPDRYEVAGLLPLGHPTGRWGVAKRRPARTLTNWEAFGNRR
jgi:nitroreductase